MDDLLLAVDPSLRGCGLAFFVGRKFVGGAVITAAPGERDIAAWVQVADAAARVQPGPGPWLVVGEKPQVYRGSKVDPDDLMQLTGVLGAVAGRLGAPGGVTWTPRQWKGSASKEATGARAHAALDAAERAVYSRCVAALPPGVEAHNLDDALALGLKACYRIR